MITTLGSLLLVTLSLDATGALLFALYIPPTVGGGYAVLMGLQIANIAGYTKRPIASSGLELRRSAHLLRERHPAMSPGFVIAVVTSFVAAALVLVYRFLCIWGDRRRDKAGIAEGFENAYQDDFTDKTNPQFWYLVNTLSVCHNKHWRYWVV
ncbi:hypothetical protein EMCG_01031 [[Emmonsia] crescens]|uniref:Uncharacterized protein n=1 Tax=[Emmonsia] crescens TaxID=73230 RepID=A0A0G2ID47_9EURO|nr:hypothetical protein EMCG_01031 [Emmonsia crescens UAMH 3008]